MMRIFLTGMVVLLLANVVSAQQTATYSQYMFNTLAINPAYACLLYTSDAADE